VLLGAQGVERILEFQLTEEEQQALSESVEAVRQQMLETGL
jgi:malate/lactate dehydrogenase